MDDTIRIDIPPGFVAVAVRAVAAEDIRAGDYLALTKNSARKPPALAVGSVTFKPHGIYAALFRLGEHPRPWYVAEHAARAGEQVRALILREGA
jgi:hypothetical protein